MTHAWAILIAAPFKFGGAGGAAYDVRVWAGLLSVLAAVWWLSAISLRNRTPRKPDNPRRLFRELCRAQRLTKKETNLLYDLADRNGLATPALLFVREDYFRTEDLTADEKIRREATALRDKLFDVAASETATSRSRLA